MRFPGFAAVTIVVASSVSVAAKAADCRADASARAAFQIFDDYGRVLSGANLLFTAPHWSSTRSQFSGSDGKVDVMCVPEGTGYEVRVAYGGYDTAHVTATASETPQLVRIDLHRTQGRYVRVTAGGEPIPGATVTITESGGTSQVLETDTNGFAHHAELRGTGEAFFEVSFAAFVPQRARVGADYKNGPVLFEMELEPICTPVRSDAQRAVR